MAALVPIRPVRPPLFAWTLPVAIQLIRPYKKYSAVFILYKCIFDTVRFLSYCI